MPLLKHNRFKFGTLHILHNMAADYSRIRQFLNPGPGLHPVLHGLLHPTQLIQLLPLVYQGRVHPGQVNNLLQG